MTSTNETHQATAAADDAAKCPPEADNSGHPGAIGGTPAETVDLASGLTEREMAAVDALLKQPTILLVDGEKVTEIHFENISQAQIEKA